MANQEVSKNVENFGKLSSEPTSPNFEREFPQNTQSQEVAWDIKIPIPIPIPRGGISIPIPGQEKGPYTQQAQALEDVLVKKERPQGNVTPADLGQDEKGNQYVIKRTEEGIQIVATKPDGSFYTVEINGRNGKLTSAKYTDAKGDDGGAVSENSINTIINTSIKLGMAQKSAPEINAPTPSPTPKAPEI